MEDSPQHREKKRKLSTGSSRERERKLTPKSSYKIGESISSAGKFLLFKGTFNETIPIALKRFTAVDIEVSNDYKRYLEILSSPENRHPNFIRYFGLAEEEVDQITYLAVELCLGSVGDYIRKKIIPPDMISTISTNTNDKEILRQSFEAVSFLHNIGYIHRNLHPENFLISCVDPNKEQFLIKLTDFQLTKKTSQKEQSGTQAKEGWMAPDSFDSNKVDAFILGCYSYYVLSKGHHPFGISSLYQKNNIKDEQNTCEVYKSDWEGEDDWKKAYPRAHANLSTSILEEEATWALKMIKELIKKDPFERKSVEDVLLRSPYFQPATYQIYDHPEAKKPGLCVIVTQAKYHNPTMDLCGKYYSGGTYPGVNIDANILDNTFSSFGYDVLSLKNLQAHEIIRYLSPNELLQMIDIKKKQMAGSTSFKDYASLVVCFLGHGGQGVVYGVDGFPVPLNTIEYDAFDDNSCLDLSGKPKVFIILACQGDKAQQEIQRQQRHGASSVPVSTFPMVMPTATGINDRERIPPVFDFIRLVSTIEGYQAFGSLTEGSAFINSLCKALNYEYKEMSANTKDPVNEKEEFEKEENKILRKSLEKKDLTQLFTTFVTPIVGRTIQTPEFRSSLSKIIRFRKMQNPGNVVDPAYDGSNQEHFIEARKYKKSLGCKARKF